MDLVVYTTSNSFKDFIDGVFEQSVTFRSDFSSESQNGDTLHLLHISSFAEGAMNWIRKQAADKKSVAVCSDHPAMKQMLDSVQAGARAYCNSYMQTQHYLQLFDLLSRGQSWFPPQLLAQTFSVAHQAVSGYQNDIKLEGLTEREKQIAVSVSDGLSNREIANQYEISERTVKTHLTNIFKKLQLKDRVGLVLHLK